jgi:uncharacterized delta-60 repeat protein
VRAAAAVVTLVLAFGSVAAWAADGDLDPSFGTSGRVKTLFPNGSFANAIAIAPDGNIVVVGAAAGPSVTGEFAVARYDANGSLDAAFDDDGMVTTAIEGGGDEARSVAVQPNGKIVVAGTDSRRRFAIVRYLQDGATDPSFGIDGIAASDLTTGDDIAYDLAIQPDGKSVVAGVADGWFTIARYLRDGSLDPSFGEGGSVFVSHGIARSVTLQPDGKIVAVGYSGRGLMVVRLRSDGRPDVSLAHDGVVSGVVGSIAPLAVALQANGKIVVVGDFDIFRCGIARFTKSGELDTTFARHGIRSVRFGSGEQNFTSVAVQADGRILAAGHVGPHEYGEEIVHRIVLARFMHDGSLDRSWGGDGKVATRFPGGASASGLALGPDGMPVVAGQAGTGEDWGFALVRYIA